MMIWKGRMTPTTEAAPAPATPPQKPRLALAIATALGVGYIPKAPGTFGSLVGIATAFLSSVFFLRPPSFRFFFPLPPNYKAVWKKDFSPLPGRNFQNTVLAFPISSALGLL